MKSDRELLELAARAAGIEVIRIDEPGAWIAGGGGVHWNPLTNDGDALRLAVLLRFEIHVWDESTDVSVAKTLPDGDSPQDTDTSAWFAESGRCGGIYAATRRAIVRASAAIGESMQ